MDDFEDFIIEQRAEPSTCKGLFFRGSGCLYWQGERLVQKTELRLLKRLSCPGCKECGPMLDDISEFAACGNLDLTNIEKGKLYSPKFTNVSKDWESGIVDDWDIEFVETSCPV